MRSAYLRKVMTVWGLLVAVILVVAMTALADPFDPDSSDRATTLEPIGPRPSMTRTSPARWDRKVRISIRRRSSSR